MTFLNFTPYLRSSVGFDRILGMLEMIEQENVPAYPPYNIEKTGDNGYRITMAVAGFDEKDIEVMSEPNLLTVKGKVEDRSDPEQFIHRGIGMRAFQRRFRLDDHIKVTGATLESGLLVIDLEREVPDALKPRLIEIRKAA